ncbi:hypothetical protein IED13_01145 [Bosea sp. SSUT16]|uniref:Uncharacterized protein n=1 Tax=Bosea spartocytisi TaxID=2773451 RepID=A0A927HWF1_9HYPH|nr:hypothetical protein [Bosea spartocytisi]MBD3844285.1 hypothetical protein [Bosea spartocytisi]MCT4470609.1 hypothetical protein [Bosea spartocytisi]
MADTPHSTPAAQGTVAGWRLVPVEPTPEMICAGVQMVSIGHGAVSGVPAWKAMLAAAPEPPASPSPEALPASGVVAARQALGDAAGWREKREELASWTGSAFLAGEKVKDELWHKGELYSFLCKLLGWLHAGEDAAAALTAAPAPEDRM